MRLQHQLQEDVILPAVQAACRSAARQWRLDPTDGWGFVCVKVLDRLDRITELRKPLEHYVRFTASREARRFYRGKAVWRHQQKED